MLTNRLKQFIKLEASGGVILLLVLIVTLALANSPLNASYQAFLDSPVHIGIGTLILEKPALLWVNEGLMAIFFMLLALEIKREFLEGELSEFKQLVLPFAGAAGGIVVPVAIYIGMNHGHDLGMRGWPIPMTTDVAFMLGIVALLGSRISNSLKVMLVALSIVDDIVAIIIIAISYSDKLSWESFAIALAGVVGLLLLNFYRVMRLAPYILIGLIIWVAVLQSGIHATLAGVVVGLIIPLRNDHNPEYSPLRHLEQRLHPWVAFFVLPVFVLFNGGVPFAGFSWASFITPVPLGIALGLFLGKLFGVFCFCWLALKLNVAKMPRGARLTHLFGVSALTGIGFTMSLFLSALAFANTTFENSSRQGVLIGSLCACVVGVAVIMLAGRTQSAPLDKL